MVTLGRNAPCPCGSGKKYKRCCGQGQRPLTTARPSVDSSLNVSCGRGRHQMLDQDGKPTAPVIHYVRCPGPDVAPEAMGGKGTRERLWFFITEL
jgi:SEC-C motif